MLHLSYSLNGLAYEPLLKGIAQIENAGFSGFEFSFNETQFNPYKITQDDIENINSYLSRKK